MSKIYFLILISLLTALIYPADNTKNPGKADQIKTDSLKSSSGNLTTTRPVSDSAGTELNQLGLKFSRIWEVDCHGNGNSLMITFVGMGVVFISLLVLYILFLFISKILLILQEKKASDAGGRTVKSVKNASSLTGEENAAIAMALHLFNSETHDFENTVLTIQRVSRNYSPWSSKIYGLRHYPQSTKKW